MDTIMESCGLLATFLATLLEGEVTVISIPLASEMGIVSLHWGLVAGFFGGYGQSWFKFLMARLYGDKLLSRKQSLKPKMDKASTWFNKRPFLFLILHKLLYGMTTVILVMSGLSKISYLKFAIYNAVSTALWLALLSSLGYFCADFMMESFSFLSENKLYVLGSLVIVGLLVWFAKHRPLTVLLCKLTTK